MSDGVGSVERGLGQLTMDYLKKVNDLNEAMDSGNPDKVDDAAMKVGKAAAQLQEADVPLEEFQTREANEVLERFDILATPQQRSLLGDDFLDDSIAAFLDSGIDRTNEARGVERGGEVATQLHNRFDDEEAVAAKQLQRRDESPAVNETVEQNAAFVTNNEAFSTDAFVAAEAIAQKFEAEGKHYVADAVRQDSASSQAAVESVKESLTPDAIAGLHAATGAPTSAETRVNVRRVAAENGTTPTAVNEDIKAAVHELFAENRPALMAALAPLLNSDDPSLKDGGRILAKWLDGDVTDLDGDVTKLADTLGPDVGQTMRARLAGEHFRANSAAAATAGEAAGLEGLDPDVSTKLTDLQRELRNYDDKVEMKCDEIIGIIRSGMPVEIMVLMVMLAMDEIQEAKLKRVMRQLAAAEALSSNKEQLDDKIKNLESQLAVDAQARTAYATKDAEEAKKDESGDGETPAAAKATGEAPQASEAEASTDQPASDESAATEGESDGTQTAIGTSAAPTAPAPAAAGANNTAAAIEATTSAKAPTTETKAAAQGADAQAARPGTLTDVQRDNIKAQLETLKQQREANVTATKRLGLPSTQSLMQQLQAEQTKMAKMLEAYSNLLRVIMDMLGVPIRNLR